MLVEPERTPYDLRFRVGGIPVRVHPLFWLGSAIFGAYRLDAGTIYLLMWVAVVLVSILVHELGHALAFRVYGVRSDVVLYVFGGLAVPWTPVVGRWRRVMVSLAGPLAGFILCGLVYASEQVAPWAESSRLTYVLYYDLIWINLWWGIFNLLPVWPLDGGQVSKEVCSHYRRDGLRLSLQISVGVAATVAVYSLLGYLDRDGRLFAALPDWFPRGSLWTAILFGMLAAQSWQLLQQQRTWTESHWER